MGPNTGDLEEGKVQSPGAILVGRSRGYPTNVGHQSPLCTTARPRGQEPFSLLWMDSVASGREKIGKVPQVS